MLDSTKFPPTKKSIPRKSVGDTRKLIKQVRNLVVLIHETLNEAVHTDSQKYKKQWKNQSYKKLQHSKI